MGFWEAVIKYISAHEYDKQCTHVGIREINGKNTIVSIWSSKSNRSPYDRLTKHQYHLFDNGVHTTMEGNLLGDLFSIMQLNLC